MKKFAAIAIAAGALFIAGAASEPAQAQGIHIGGRGFHLDLGSPHYRTYSGGYYGGYGYPAGYNRFNSGYRGHAHWHDTSHYDYHPGEYRRHGNHYHYVPGHYDFHQQGHWDHH